jgi:hypothetical protein
MPAAADFLGFTATSTASFSLALVFAVSLCITLLKKDTYAFRSSRYV